MNAESRCVCVCVICRKHASGNQIPASIEFYHMTGAASEPSDWCSVKWNRDNFAHLVSDKLWNYIEETAESNEIDKMEAWRTWKQMMNREILWYFGNTTDSRTHKHSQERFQTGQRSSTLMSMTNWCIYCTLILFTDDKFQNKLRYVASWRTRNWTNKAVLMCQFCNRYQSVVCMYSLSGSLTIICSTMKFNNDRSNENINKSFAHICRWSSDAFHNRKRNNVISLVFSFMLEMIRCTVNIGKSS